jgi:tetratricopeptide (TPR) repeat protein
LQKAIEVNPWSSDYRAALALVCYQAGDWSGAVAACEAAIRLNPELEAPRSLLIQSFLQSNQREKADAEFQTLIRRYPASREVWQRWYESETKAGPGDVNSSTKSAP